MRRIVLAVALLITACNLTAGVAYAALCLGSGGGRACGSTCQSLPDGNCGCSGSCTSDELRWVEGAGKGGDEELLAE